MPNQSNGDGVTQMTQDDDFALHPEVNTEREWVRHVLPRMLNHEWNIAECGRYRINRRMDGGVIMSEQAFAAICMEIIDRKG